MFIDETQLRDFVRDSGLVSRADFEVAAKEADGEKQSVGGVLVAKGKISQDDLRKMQAYILGVPFVDLSNEKIAFEILSLIPEPIARSHNIIAFKKTDESLEVAMLDTDDLAAVDFIKKKTQLKILPRLTDANSVKSALLQYQKSLKAEFGDLIRAETDVLKALPESGAAPETPAELKKQAEDLPIVRIVDTLLKHAALQNASDIHIEPQEKELVVRYRIDGLLRDAMILPKHVSATIAARIKVLASLKLDEKRLPQDGRFKIEIGGDKVALRVSILPTYFGEKVVMRLLREGASGFTLEALGFHGEGLERIHEALKLTTGMILTTGPTGSGKTTTLYTMLDILNTPDVNISTIEDPIEYQLPRINQSQVKPEIGFSFANGLRALVRQDPDIIMVGEIRDNETASLAINAALTGHLVLSTLHTNSAAGAIPRLIDMKSEPFLLVSTLQVILAQRLVRQLAETKEKYFLTKAGIATLAKAIDLDRVLATLKAERIVPPNAVWESVPFFRPRPAPDAPDGFASRVGIHEVMKITPTIRDLIIKGGTSAEIETQARKEGMLTMLEDGIFQCVQGETTIEEVLRVVSE